MPEPRDPDARKRNVTPDEEEGPVAVGGPSWLDDEEDEAAGAVDATPGEDQDEQVPLPPGAEDLEPATAVDRPGTELATGAACLALALATFLPWYGAPGQTVSGFSSGSWGPIIFFLGIAGALIVALRRFNVPVSFPVETGAVLEGIGWVSVVGLIFKRFFPPVWGPVKLGPSEPYFLLINGQMVALLCAVAIAMLAGRLTAGSPFMIRPGWMAGFAGKLGVAILGVAVLAGISFGFFNETGPVSPQDKVDVRTFKGAVPPCMRAVPLPTGLKISEGKEVIDKETKKRTACSIMFSMDSSLSRSAERFETVLKRGNVPFRPPFRNANLKTQRTIVVTEPCGMITLGKAKKRTAGSVVLLYEAVCPYAGLTGPAR